MSDNQVVTCCHSCGLMVKFLGTKAHTVFCCPRCTTVIWKNHSHTARNCFVLALSALVLFIPTIFSPVLNVIYRTGDNNSSLVDTIFIFFSEGYHILGIFLTFTTLIFPFLYLSLLLYVCLSILINRKLLLSNHALTLFCKIKGWAMMEIFLIGILISVVKLAGMFELSFGAGFYLLVVISIIGGLIDFYFDRHLFWSLWSSNE